jgi:hypothetical protein
MKVHLDNNIVSAIAKDDEPAESDALDRLLIAWRDRKVDLVTSELTLAEIKRYQDARMRAAIERIFRLLEHVEIVRWDKLVGIHSYGDARTWINTPMIENQPEYGALLKLGLEAIDAQHVYVAGKQACDIFLTCDGVILRQAERGLFARGVLLLTCAHAARLGLPGFGRVVPLDAAKSAAAVRSATTLRSLSRTLGSVVRSAASAHCLA